MDIKEHFNNLMLKYDSMILDTPEFIDIKNKWCGKFMMYKTNHSDKFFYIRNVFYDSKKVCLFCDYFENISYEHSLILSPDIHFHKYDIHSFTKNRFFNDIINSFVEITKDEYISQIDIKLNKFKKLINHKNENN
jgi:hypothetical protein